MISSSLSILYRFLTGLIFQKHPVLFDIIPNGFQQMIQKVSHQVLPG